MTKPRITDQQRAEQIRIYLRARKAALAFAKMVGASRNPTPAFEKVLDDTFKSLLDLKRITAGAVKESRGKTLRLDMAICRPKGTYITGHAHQKFLDSFIELVEGKGFICGGGSWLESENF